MKLVKIVKYQRIPYGELEPGDDYAVWLNHFTFKAGELRTVKGKPIEVNPKQVMIALDTDKYPPEVTYNIEGIPDREMHECQDFGTTEPSEIGFSTEGHEDYVLWFGVDEIETRFE